MPPLLQADFAGNSVAEWMGAILMALSIFTVLYVLRSMVLARVGKLALRLDLRGAGVLFGAFQKTRLIGLLSVALFAASRSLDQPEMSEFLRVGMVVLLCLQAGFWAASLLGGWRDYARRVQLNKNPGVATTIGLLHMILSIVVWSAVLLLILDNLGFNVTTLIAGLGIGGVAVALALQGVLGDLFASLFIVVDKTFSVGDFLIIDEYLGTVEYIGWKTTRLRSLSGEQIIFSNSNMLASRMRNYGRMYRRRIDVGFKVSPATSRANLRLIPQLIREAVMAQQNTAFDRAHFKSFDRAPYFEYVYFVESPDFNLYMDIQQEINLYLHEKFEQANIRLQRDDTTDLVLEHDVVDLLRDGLQSLQNNRPAGENTAQRH